MNPFLVQHYVRASARLTPEKVAVCGGPRDEALTYAQLEAASNQLANCLRAIGVPRQARAIVCMARSPRSVCSMLGILKADAVYVPLVASALPRTRRILEDCAPSVIVCDAQSARSIVPLAREVDPAVRVVVLGATEAGTDQGQRDVDACSTDAPPSFNIDADLAYILYTSGSTGQPKGVMISHANIRNYIEWAVDFLEITERDEVFSTAPFEFDMSTFDIYCPQKVGATLHIAPDELLIFPNALLEFMEAHHATIWKGASALLLHLDKLGALQPHRVPRLRAVLFGGARLPTQSLMRWMDTFPNKRFYNAYGPTEATGVSGCHFVASRPDDARADIPIGRPRSNLEFLVLGDDGRPVAAGQQGELYIRGAGVSPGYWRDAEKTARAFVANPVTGNVADRVHKSGDLVFESADGVFHLVGRADDQVKLRGYRVTLGEIATELSALSEVREHALLMVTHGAHDEAELIAFVELSSGATPADVQRLLKARLPLYMVPAQILQIDAIPLNERGKPDRAALLKRFESR